MVKNFFNISGDSVFYTIQGEGPSMGCPAIFLRLHFCNLACSWCDTQYTWDRKRRDFWVEREIWSVQKTKQEIQKAWKCADKNIPRRLVITGGEPLLQKDYIDALIKIMPGWIFEIETNGTIQPTKLQLQKCQFNCSPKLCNSGNTKILRLCKQVLKSLNGVKTVFKFIVTRSSDIDEIQKDFVKKIGIDASKIIIMPQELSPKSCIVMLEKLLRKSSKKDGGCFLAYTSSFGEQSGAHEIICLTHQEQGLRKQ